MMKGLPGERNLSSFWSCQSMSASRLVPFLSCLLLTYLIKVGRYRGSRFGFGWSKIYVGGGNL